MIFHFSLPLLIVVLLRQLDWMADAAGRLLLACMAEERKIAVSYLV
jgi:hypothetical protein